MAQILEAVKNWAEHLVSTMGYIGIALLMFLENIFPPIPSEVIMPFAGSLVSKGEMSFIGVFVAGTIGALVGVVAIYYIGIAIDDERAKHWFKNYGRYFLLSENDYNTAMEKFEKHGGKMVMVGRLMPAIRSLISLPAGLKHMHIGKFLIYTAIGTSVWNLILLGSGLYLGSNWQQVISFVDSYEMVIWILLGLAVAYFIFRKVKAHFGSSESYAQTES